MTDAPCALAEMTEAHVTYLERLAASGLPAARAAPPATHRQRAQAMTRRSTPAAEG